MILVVADYPTAMQYKKKDFDKGPAIQLLRTCLTQMHCDNDLQVIMALEKPRGRTYTLKKKDLVENRDILLTKIKQSSASLVLLLGKIPTQIVYNDLGIKLKDYYGKFFEVEGKKVCTIMHPGVLFHKPDDFKLFRLQLKALTTTTVDSGETSWKILNTTKEVDDAIKFLRDNKVKKVGADIETTSLDYRIAEVCVIGISYAKNKVFVLPRELCNRLKDFFKIPNMEWVWQGGKYDRKVLWRRGLLDYDANGWHIFPHEEDTIIRHYLLDETSPHDLGFLSKIFLHAKDYKYKMNQEFKNVTLETYDKYFDALCERVAVDADYTLQIDNKLIKEFQKPENASLQKCYDMVEKPATSFLCRVEQNGLLIDAEYLRKTKLEYEKLLEKKVAKIKELAAPYWEPEKYKEEMGAKTAPDTFNPASPKQVAWLLFYRLHLKSRRRKKDSTGNAVLMTIEPKCEIVDAILEFRSLAKELSTYVVGILKLIDTDGRVHPDFSLHTTATGRLACKKPNAQNLPASHGFGDIRRAVIPPKGKILMEVDYSGAELRWLAFLSNCPVLKSVYLENRNLHKETATALYGPAFTPVQKMRAKAVNFGE